MSRSGSPPAKILAEEEGGSVSRSGSPYEDFGRGGGRLASGSGCSLGPHRDGGGGQDFAKRVRCGHKLKIRGGVTPSSWRPDVTYELEDYSSQVHTFNECPSRLEQFYKNYSK